MGVKPLWVGSLLIVAVASAALSAIQRTTRTVPVWSIQFVDQLGRPFAGLEVRQSWQNYSLESNANFAMETTDESGVAVFPARYIQASLLERLLGPLESFLFRGGIHAGYGAHSSVLPTCDLRFSGPSLPIMREAQLPGKATLAFSGSGNGRAECVHFEMQAKEADRLAEASH